MPLDVAINVERSLGAHFPDDLLWGPGLISARALAARFVVASFVVDFGSYQEYSQLSVRRRSPETFLVHSRRPIDSLPEFIRLLISEAAGA